VKTILAAGGFALLLSLFGTPLLIRALARKGYGQIIRDDGPSSHHVKRGTPTMGGIIIIFASISAYLVAHLLSGTAITASAGLVIGLVVALGLVGFLDDWLKVSRKQSQGLTSRQKLIGQVLVASIFAYFGTKFADSDGLTPISSQLSTVRDTSIALGASCVVV